jgi:hypothetical protein
MTCECCGKSTELLAKYCQWCGHGPKKRRPEEGQKECTSCGEACAPEFSYCPWCGHDQGGDRQPRKKAAGFRLDLKCPECEGSVAGAMEYCPWCDEDLDIASFAENCACASCGSQIRPEWHFCIYCGGYAEPRHFSLTRGVQVVIEKNALFFLTLATIGRHREKHPKSLLRSYGEDEGLETLGFLFGTKSRSSFRIRHVFPVAIVEPGREGSDHDPKFLDQLKTSFISYQQSLCPPLTFPLECIGTFHSHPGSDRAVPGIVDYESMRNDAIGLMVALKKTQGEKTWEWNQELGTLDGCAGKLFFRIGAYRFLTTGEVEQARLSLEAD